MTDVADAVVAALAGPVAGAVPVIAARIPAGPAAELGRIGAPPGAHRRPAGLSVHLAAGLVAARSAESPVLGALRELGPLLAERLLGALELTVPELDLAGAADLSSYLPQRPGGRVVFAHLASGQESQAETAVALLEQLHPGAADLAISLARGLAGHELVAPLLTVPPDVTGEAPIAAAHGAAYLALAVATASAVAGGLRLPGADGPAAAVVGVAAGAAVLLLRQTPMPARYAAALLDKVRAEYRLPVRASAYVQVSDHRFALVEGEFPVAADFSGNGLVAVVPGGAVIRTGVAEGTLPVTLAVVKEPPPVEEHGWDDIVEVSWRAAAGQASVIGPAGPDALAGRALSTVTPPWPGDYRLRVHASGRDDADDDERYELAVWQAPAGPEIVHKRTGRLGYRLRGEPEPDRPRPPEHAYRWVKASSLDQAATITVVTGATVAQVLRAFGTDPGQPESLRAIDEEMTDRMSIDPWVAVLDTGTAVLAVEYNGWQGSDEQVLCQASAGGRAASMFWNINGVRRHSFAEGGRLLASFEWLVELEDAEPAVAAALDGLDFDDPRDLVGKGLVAVQRFTGYGMTAEDLERIEAADTAFRIAPGP